MIWIKEDNYHVKKNRTVNLWEDTPVFEFKNEYDLNDGYKAIKDKIVNSFIECQKHKIKNLKSRFIKDKNNEITGISITYEEEQHFNHYEKFRTNFKFLKEKPTEYRD